MPGAYGSLLGPLASGVLLLLTGCQAPPPIRLHPVASVSTPRRVVRAIPQPRPDSAEVSACPAPAPSLSEQRKEELFRQFAAQRPDAGERVAVAQSSMPAASSACRAAGR